MSTLSTASIQVITSSVVLPFFVILFLGFCIFILYKTRHDRLPIHICWGFFFGAEASHFFSHEICAILKIFPLTETCWDNCLILLSTVLFSSAIVVLQLDRFAAIYFNSKYHTIVTPFRATLGCLCAFVLSLLTTALTIFFDGNYNQCSDPLVIRYTRMTNIYVEGITKLVTILIITVVSSYAAVISFKPPPVKVHPTLMLSNAQQEAKREEIEFNVRRKEGTRDEFYLGGVQTLSHGVAGNSSAERRVPMENDENASRKEYLQMTKRTLVMNKIPILLIIGMSAPSFLGIWFANCEVSNDCNEFIEKHKLIKLLHFITLAAQIYFVLRNIKPLVSKMNNNQF